MNSAVCRSNFHGKIKLIACNGAEPSDYGETLIGKIANGLSTPDRKSIGVSGVRSTFAPEMSMADGAGMQQAASADRRYLRSFYFGELQSKQRDYAREERLKLKPADFGARPDLAQVRKTFVEAKAPDCRAFLLEIVKYKNAIRELKQGLIAGGAMISKKNAKQTVHSKPRNH